MSKYLLPPVDDVGRSAHPHDVRISDEYNNINLARRRTGLGICQQWSFCDTFSLNLHEESILKTYRSKYLHTSFNIKSLQSQSIKPEGA
jgi:hypothetical protein